MIKLKNLLFESEPVVAHCPGPLHENWKFFSEEVFAAATQPRPSQESAIFVTWHGPDRAEKPNGILERCAARHGCEVVVLRHKGADWTNARKLAMTAEALEKTRAEFVVGLDSCDVLLVDHPDEIVGRFRKHFACDLLFNATGSACWPELPEFVMFESSLPAARYSHGRCWLNSGAFVGRTSFCGDYFRQLADFARTRRYENDQTVVKATWPHYYPRVQIDYHCEIFQWFNEEPQHLEILTPPSDRQRRMLKELQSLDQISFGALIGGDRSDASKLLRTFPSLRLWVINDGFPSVGREDPSGLASSKHRNRCQSQSRERLHWMSRSAKDAATFFPNRSLDFVVIVTPCTRERKAIMDKWAAKLRSDGVWL